MALHDNVGGTYESWEFVNGAASWISKSSSPSSPSKAIWYVDQYWAVGQLQDIGKSWSESGVGLYLMSKSASVTKYCPYSPEIIWHYTDGAVAKEVENHDDVIVECWTGKGCLILEIFLYFRLILYFSI